MRAISDVSFSAIGAALSVGTFAFMLWLFFVMYTRAFDQRITPPPRNMLPLSEYERHTISQLCPVGLYILQKSLDSRTDPDDFQNVTDSVLSKDTCLVIFFEVRSAAIFSLCLSHTHR